MFIPDSEHSTHSDECYEVVDSILSKKIIISDSQFLLSEILTAYVNTYLLTKYKIKVSSNTVIAFDDKGLVINAFLNIGGYFTISPYFNKNNNQFHYLVKKSFFVFSCNYATDAVRKFLFDLIKHTNVYHFLSMGNLCINNITEDEIVNTDISTIVNKIVNYYIDNSNVSVMIFCSDINHVELLSKYLQKILFDNNYFAHMITKLNMTINFYDDLINALNFSSSFTPVILQFTNSFKCYQNICEGNNQNEYLTDKETINAFYDKITEIEGIIALTIVKCNEKDLDSYIENQETIKKCGFKSMYREGRINIYI